MPEPNSGSKRIAVLIAIGLIAGAMSGLFGVGGGIIIVPLLLMLGFDARLAAGTSVAAILPTSIVGGASYAIVGDIDWVIAALLAVGVIAGAQLGSFILSRIPKDVVFWAFIGFLILVIVSLWIVIPERGTSVEITLLSGLGLVATGFGTGILSGVLGIGGGVVVVPALMFFFGASDLVAKGSSLLMMVPGSISATIGNAIRKNVDLRAAVLLGITACVGSPLGVYFAHAISPSVSNILFAALLIGVAIQLVVKQLGSR